MLRVFRLTSAILAIAAIISGVSPALAAGEGVIVGQVANRTLNGSPVSAVEVTLTLYLNGKAYESGTIGEKEYRTQRARVKASLLEVYAHSREP